MIILKINGVNKLVCELHYLSAASVIPMFAEPNSLPGAKVQLAISDRNC